MIEHARRKNVPTGTPLRGAPATGALLIAIVSAALSAGCRKEQPVPSTQPTTTAAAPATQTASAPDPDLPIDLDNEALVSHALIKDTTVADREKLAKYKQDAHADSGHVVGVCYVPFEKEVPIPPSVPIWPTGDNAVVEPAAGEVAYFEQHPPIKPVDLSGWDRDRKRYGVGRAVLIFRDIESGKRESLSRPSYVIHYDGSNIQVPRPGYNYGQFNICFAPLFERVQLANTEFFDCRIEIGLAGQETKLLETTLKGYSDEKFPGEHYGSNFNMRRPEMTQSPPIRQTGHYLIGCRRHPWLRAHMFATDNPYVAVSDDRGMFNVADVPVGKYAVEVWHERYEPVPEHKTVEVEIATSRTTELMVEFKPPPELTDPKWPTDKLVPKWVYVGPFATSDEAKHVYGPEGGPIDFAASYAGKDGQKVSWRLALADGNGAVDLNKLLNANLGGTTWFFSSQINAAADGPVLLGIGPTDYKLWVNGQLVNDRKRAYREPAFGKDTHFLATKLRKGLNTLLVQTTAWREWPYTAAVQASYAGPDAPAPYAGNFTPAVPTGGHLREGYLVNATSPVGKLRGSCFIKHDQPVAIPRSVQRELTGNMAIREPVEGELAYYSGQRRPAEAYLYNYDGQRRRVAVQQAATMLRKIEVGKRLPLRPSGFAEEWQFGQLASFATDRQSDYGGGRVAFAPAGEPLLLQPTQPFADTLVISDAATGKTVWSGEVPAYADENFPNQPYGISGGMARPEPIQTDPLPAGHYRIRSKRRPWIDGHAFVSEHPYVASSNSRGDFEMADVPPGKYEVIVRHPTLTAVTDTFTVEIAEGKTAELEIEFKAPPEVTNPKPPTDQVIGEWATVGPFDRDMPPRLQDAPLDFAAAYDGKDDKKVSWQLVKAGKDGRASLNEFTGQYLSNSTCYLAAELASPKAQPIVLGIGSCEVAEVFLNGRCVHDYLQGHGWTGPDYDFARGTLKAGANTLLVRLSTGGSSPTLAVSYKADGVKVSVPEKVRRPGYLYDPQAVTGNVRGWCFIPFEEPVRMPSALPIDLVGPMAIKSPGEGEAAWYEGFRRPQRSFGLGGWDGGSKRYAVFAAVSLGSVAGGTRYPLRGTYLSADCWSSQIETPRNHNYGTGTIAFARTGEPLAISATELFPNRVIVTGPDGKTFFQADLPAYADDRYPGKAHGEVGGMREPERVVTPPLERPGHYVVTFARHPWKRAEVFVTDNPFVSTTAWHNGEFRLDGVAPGKYVLEAFSPGGFEPVSKTVAVVVEAGKTADVQVPFKVPELLNQPPKLTDKTVAQWAAIGPFEREFDKPLPPEEKIDVKTPLEGKGARQVRWQLVNAGADGIVRLFSALGRNDGACGYFLTAVLNSPKDQTVLLGVGTGEQAKIWVNGEMILYHPWGRGPSTDSNFLLARLKKGANTLLVKLTTNGGEPGAGVSFGGEGVTASAPAGAARPAYLTDPAAGSGELRGTCFVPFDKEVSLPPAVPIEPRIADAQPGELAYYQVHCPSVPVLLGRFDAGNKRYPVSQAVVVLKEVKAGRRYPFRPTSFTLNFRSGQAETYGGQNAAYGRVAFGPTGAGLGLATTELFPSRLVLTGPAGEQTFDVEVPAYKDDRFPGVSAGEANNMAGPPWTYTPPIEKPGRYVLADKRHPWRKSYLLVSDHPCAAMTDGNGNFRITDIPPGKYEVEVWHPDYEAAKATSQVEIPPPPAPTEGTPSPAKPVELNVEFKPPPLLASPPPVPETPILKWSFLGVFDAGFTGPEKDLDLKAKVKARGGAEVGWKTVSAGEDGRIDLATAAGESFKDVQNSSSYFCATINSPDSQPVAFNISGDDGATAWLNGTAIGDRYAMGRLSKGANILLVRLANGGGPGSLAVQYHADGAVAGLPKPANP